jgi:hypothetical protein
VAASQRLSHTSSTRGEGAWGPTKPETGTRLVDPSTLRAVEFGSRSCSQPACDRDGYAASLVCGYCTSASHRAQTHTHTHTYTHIRCAGWEEDRGTGFGRGNTARRTGCRSGSPCPLQQRDGRPGSGCNTRQSGRDGIWRTIPNRLIPYPALDIKEVCSPSAMSTWPPHLIIISLSLLLQVQLPVLIQRYLIGCRVSPGRQVSTFVSPQHRSRIATPSTTVNSCLHITGQGLPTQPLCRRTLVAASRKQWVSHASLTSKAPALSP